jgi:hypothetical protein
MADCGYAEDCYLLKYLLPFTQAYRKAAKGITGCSGQSAQKIVIPEMEEIVGISHLESEEDYENGIDDYGDGDGDGDEYEDGNILAENGSSSASATKKKRKWRKKSKSNIKHWPKNFKWLQPGKFTST